MSSTPVTEFLNGIHQDPSLKNELETAADLETFKAIAHEKGYDFQQTDLENVLKEMGREGLLPDLNPGVGPRQHITPS